MSSNGKPVPSVGRFCEAHGAAKANGETVVFEAVPDGVRPAEAVSADTLAKPNGKPFTSETARSAAERRWALAKVGDFARQELEFIPADDFAPFDTARRDILGGKLDELSATFRLEPDKPAPVSSGVAAVVRGWAWLVSFAEYYAVRAAKTGSEDDADRARRFVKDASIELAKAHELMRAEAAARPRDPGATHRELAAAFSRGER